MNSKNKKQLNQKGQAIMEMMVIMLALMICMVSIFVVIAISMGNIDILMCSKTIAELEAYDQKYGDAGREIRKWDYTIFGDGKNQIEVPFLVKDQENRQSANLFNNYWRLNNEEYTNAILEDYHYHDFVDLQTETGVNFANTDMYNCAYKAANLHLGACGRLQQHNILGVSCQKYLQVADILAEGYINIEKISNAKANEVYMPSMRIRD